MAGILAANRNAWFEDWPVLRLKNTLVWMVNHPNRIRVDRIKKFLKIKIVHRYQSRKGESKIVPLLAYPLSVNLVHIDTIWSPYVHHPSRCLRWEGRICGQHRNIQEVLA